MKKAWKIGIGVAVVAVIALGISVVAGKIDRRKEALKAVQNFFEVSKESEWNQYLEYCDFEELMFKKDMKVTGTCYTDIAKLTIQTDLEGIVDKSGNKMQFLTDVGLGGMPFAEFDGYSDDTNLYLDSEIFQNRMLKFDYTQNLEKQGEAYGIGRSYVTILQKGYISLFQMAVSENKYEKIEMLLENDQLKEDLVKIYDTMGVECQENPDEITGRYVYRINFPVEDVNIFLQDMAIIYPEFERDGYLKLVNKLVDHKKGMNITLTVDKEGVTTGFSMYNAENGYEIILKRNEQEKAKGSGFENQFGIAVLNNGAGIVNGEILFDYNAKDGVFQVEAGEDITGIHLSASGVIKTDSKKEKFTADISALKLVRGQHDVDLSGNITVTFGEYAVDIPQRKEVDVIHGEEKELREIQNLFWQEIEGIAGSKIRQFLNSIGITY